MDENPKVAEKTCFELIRMGDELAKKIDVTHPIPESFVLSRYPLDIATIRESCTNFTDIKNELSEQRLAAGLRCICGGDCKNNVLALEILDEAARRLARRMYSEFTQTG